jgi:hypothetical protein
MLIAQGVWAPHTMVNVEELDPDPFLKLLGKIGLPTHVKDITPKNGKPSADGMPASAAKSFSVDFIPVW